ncbi:MAG: membrane protein required for colicin V production [Nitrospinales bacterium]|jgi:membrane protein required for colicin V production
MTTFDIVVYSILGLSVIFSLFKGFVKEVFSLLSYLGGYLMASKYQGVFSQLLMESIPSKPIAKLIAFAGIYIMTAIIISLMGRIARGFIMSATQLSGFDRLAGGFVGFARGVMIVVAVTFPLQFFPEVGKKFMKDSQTAPHLAKVLKFVSQNPEALNIRKKLTDFDMGGMKEKYEELKNMKDMANQFEDLKKILPNMDGDSKKGEKPLDEYSKEDIQKLTDILKSVEKK